MLWGTTAKTIATTPESIWAYFKDAGQRPWTRVTLDTQHERVYGDIAIVSGAYTFSNARDGVTTNDRPARYHLRLPSRRRPLADRRSPLVARPGT